MQLRPYQIEALDAVAARTVDRGLVALPTGCGKGHIAGHLTEALDTQNILYLAHREELLNQLLNHVERVIGFGGADIEQAQRRAAPSARCVIASVPTLNAMGMRRLEDLGPERFEAIVVDEAHHGTAESYVRIWQRFGLLDEHKRKVDDPPVPLIGLTATPGRGDNVGLHNVFDEILYQLSLADAIRDGWLVPIHAYTVQTGTDLDNVRTRGGEYVESDLAKAVNTDERNETIFDAWQRNASGLKTLIFCVDVAHAQELAQFFEYCGTPARWVAGIMKPDERRAVMDWFEQTPGAVLTNCQLVTEGVDVPSVECVVMGRPTKSKTLYAQCLGRGTRLARGAHDYTESVALGKDKLILLDVTDAVSDLGRRAMRVGDLFGLPFPTKALTGQELIREAQVQETELRAPTQRRIGIQTTAVAVDLFAKPVNLAGSSLAWVDTGGMLRLPLKDHGVIEVVSDALDRWEARLWTKDAGYQTLYRTAEQRDLVDCVEAHVREHYSDVMGLVSKHAGWRHQEPSEKQVDLCRKLGIAIPPGATKGEVSVALDRYFAQKKAVGR